MAIELRASGARALIEPRYGGRIHHLFVEIDGREDPLLFAPPEPAMFDEEQALGSGIDVNFESRYVSDNIWGGIERFDV